MDDVKISIEKISNVRVEMGRDKAFRAHIIGPRSEHHAEGDSPQEALVLAAMHWYRHS